MIYLKNGSDCDIVLLQQRLDHHIEEFVEHCARVDRRWDALLAAQKTNTASIGELITSTKQLNESTRDIITVWNAAHGTMKTLSVIGNFIKWLGGCSAIGLAVKYLSDVFVK
jgi:hypothetical protein